MMEKIILFLFACVCLEVKMETTSSTRIDQFSGERRGDGDFLDTLSNAHDCIYTFGAKNKERLLERCHCQQERPIFTMKSDSRYGCYKYQSICRECSSYQEASVIKQGDVEILNTTTNGTLKEMISSCEPEMRVAALSIIHYSQKTQVYIGKMQYTEQNESAQVTLEVPVNTTTKLLLEGKLATLQMWCSNASLEEIARIRKENTVFLKIDGQFTYPDTDLYIAMTTMTSFQAASSEVNAHKKRGSKKLFFYVVVPVVVFMLLVAVIILRVNCREIKKNKHKYWLRFFDEEKNDDVGIINPAYQTTILRQYNERKTLPNSNSNNSTNTTNDEKVSDEFKIYTIVDLSGPNLVTSTPVQQQSNLEYHQGQPRTTVSSFKQDDNFSIEKDDDSIVKYDMDSDVDSIAKENDSMSESDEDFGSINRYIVSSIEHNSGDDSKSANYHSDDLDVEFYRPPPPPDREDAKKHFTWV